MTTSSMWCEAMRLLYDSKMAADSDNESMSCSMELYEEENSVMEDILDMEREQLDRFAHTHGTLVARSAFLSTHFHCPLSSKSSFSMENLSSSTESSSSSSIFPTELTTSSPLSSPSSPLLSPSSSSSLSPSPCSPGRSSLPRLLVDRSVSRRFKVSRGERQRHTSIIERVRLPQWLASVLSSSEHNPQVVQWVDKSRGIFFIRDPSELAWLWGSSKNSKHGHVMTYDNLTKSIRTWYGKGGLWPVNRKMMYAFTQDSIKAFF